MKGDPLPDCDHISRYCPYTRLTESGGPSGAAFRLRKEEKYLSVNWLEILGQSNRANEIAELRSILSRHITLAPSGRLAVLNVGAVQSHVLINSTDSRSLRILHEPLDNDASHTGIFDMNEDDDLIADLIAQIVIEVYPAQI